MLPHFHPRKISPVYRSQLFSALGTLKTHSRWVLKSSVISAESSILWPSSVCCELCNIFVLVSKCFLGYRLKNLRLVFRTDITNLSSNCLSYLIDCSILFSIYLHFSTSWDLVCSLVYFVILFLTFFNWRIRIFLSLGNFLTFVVVPFIGTFWEHIWKQFSIKILHNYFPT